MQSVTPESQAPPPAGAKVGFFGPMKTLASARQDVEELGGGRVRAWIEHETMRGVTPEMLRWWFENIDATTRWNGHDFSGAEVPVYRLWHPYDHIAVRWRRRVLDPAGRLARGSLLEIQENLGATIPVRARARVTRFDDEAFDFELLQGPIRFGELLHHYTAVDGGASFYTEMRVDVQLPMIGSLLTRLARRFRANDRLLRTWIQHNVEESGETEKFVPALFQRAMQEPTLTP
jgi:hypothetical protein